MVEAKRRRMAMDLYWICDTCGEKIKSPEEGLIEWYSCNDENGIRRSRKIRLVHQLSASPLRKIKMFRKGCAFDLHENIVNVEGFADNRPLAGFLGPDGLMQLLSFVAKGEFPVVEVVEMIKRLHVPGYEVARHYFRAAISEGVVDAGVPGNFYEQSQINAVLKWIDEKRH
jgi:hypothetical protein